ncbi:MAG: hypothetical protein LH606_14910, partial [Cytophagaceae bacterium]|nr:hypothetical protein [Cytophagaceae bacterium]
MTIQQKVLESTFQEMGYASMADFAIQKAREELLREKKRSADEIARFEAKYGMTYPEFVERFFELTTFGLFEREDDLMDWKMEVHVRT